MFCKVPLYTTKQSPATTKFDGLRESLSACHSLIYFERYRDGTEASCPPQLWSVGVEPESNRMPNQNSTLMPEEGSVGNLRFLLSSIGSTTANASLLGATVYNVFCCGRESFAAIEQDGYSAQFIYRPPIYAGPLALNASVGYKFAEVPRILNDQWVFNLRCTLA